ncbi:MAG TPA: hypothetical protein VLO10_00360 [Candidatus Deferrimicrobium sp.]|nr:hypothetical protein [Candidatus Deferrimicrobium sp.]
MDLPDDADGRVAIFTVDEPIDELPPAGAGGGSHGTLGRLGAWMDAAYAGVAIAVLLAVVLALGLLLLRR